MSDIGDKTVLVYDGGLFSELALRLSRSFKRTLFQCSISCPHAKVHESAVGDFAPVEVITDFWPVKNDIDLFVFPDCAHAGLQNELIAQGFPVWGSRNGANLELQRIRFKEILKDIGLKVGPYEVCNGLNALREFLRDKKDRYIKISKFRGNTETRHWIDQRQSVAILDEFAITFGPVAESIRFVVEEAIPTEIEWGLDTYFAGGKYPTMVAHGPEIKDKCYTGAMVKWSDLPDQVREVAEAMQPVLAESGYTNMVSMEIRIDEEGNAFFTDPTCRFPSPAGEAQMELYSNLPEIIWAGAHGDCIEPEYEHEFAVECIFDHTGPDTAWRTLVVPDEIRRFVKLYNACEVEGDLYAVPPFPHLGDSIGAIIGLGDTMEEAIDTLKWNASKLKDQPVTIPIDTLVDALKEIEEADKQGVEFASTEMPEPETVVSD